MNERTARLLNQWAEFTDQKPSDLKRWWRGLTAAERTKQRAIIVEELDAEYEEVEVPEDQ